MQPEMSQLLIYGCLVVAVTVLTTPLDVAADQCTTYHGFRPGVSCEDIYEKNPGSRDRPGYYWITNGPRKVLVYCGMNYSGSSCEEIYTYNPEISNNNSGYYRISDQWTYCNLTATVASFCPDRRGKWTRIGYFNISAGDNCPSGWKKDTQSGVSFCRPPGDDQTARLCYSTSFSTNGMAYTSVCGRARGYQKGNVWGFWGSTATIQGSSIEGSYVDGLSITHGIGPRHHIWTYAVGYYDGGSYGCPCDLNASSIPPPVYVDTNYYCEPGTVSVPPSGSTYYFTDPLWDGLGCSINNNCCSIEHQPWFYRDLGASTTDDIEARICISYLTYASGAVVVDHLELYIQ